MYSIFILFFMINFTEYKASILSDSNAFILFTDTKEDIRIAHLNRDITFIKSNEAEILFQKNDREKSYGIDYGLSGNLLLWSDQSSNFASPFNQSKANILGIDAKKVLSKSKFYDLARIAFDWIHDLLYWTQDKEIHVISIMNTNLRYVVIENESGVIRNIAIDPLESFLFWIQWDNNGDNDRIMRSNEDGSNITVLVNSSIEYSYAITLDLYDKTFYWIDADLYTLSSIGYYGNNRKVILKSEDLFSVSYRMDFYEDYIFWVNDNYKSVLKTHKSGLNGTARLTVIKSDEYIHAIKIVHPLRQPISRNRCLNSNCSHLCIPCGINSFRCLCPSIKYYKLRNNEKCSTEEIREITLKASDSRDQKSNDLSSYSKSEDIEKLITKEVTQISFNTSDSNGKKSSEFSSSLNYEYNENLVTKEVTQISFNTSDSSDQKSNDLSSYSKSEDIGKLVTEANEANVPNTSDSSKEISADFLSSSSVLRNTSRIALTLVLFCCNSVVILKNMI